MSSKKAIFCVYVLEFPVYVLTKIKTLCLIHQFCPDLTLLPGTTVSNKWIQIFCQGHWTETKMPRLTALS